MSGHHMAGPNTSTLLDMYSFTVSDNMYTGQRKDEFGRHGFSGHCNYCQKPLDPPCVTCWKPSKTMAFAMLSAGLMAATLVAIVCLHTTLLRNENRIIDIHAINNANRRNQHEKDRSSRPIVIEKVTPFDGDMPNRTQHSSHQNATSQETTTNVHKMVATTFDSIKPRAINSSNIFASTEMVTQLPFQNYVTTDLARLWSNFLPVEHEHSRLRT